MGGGATAGAAAPLQRSQPLPASFKHPQMRPLPTATAAQVAAAHKPRHEMWRAGMIVCGENTPIDCMYVVEEGTFHAWSSQVADGRTVVDTLQRGDAFYEEALHGQSVLAKVTIGCASANGRLVKLAGGAWAGHVDTRTRACTIAKSRSHILQLGPSAAERDSASSSRLAELFRKIQRRTDLLNENVTTPAGLTRALTLRAA